MSQSNVPPLELSVRADLFRVAQSFTDSRVARFAGVRIEPMRGGAGVIMVGYDGADMIALADPTGEINRAATITISKALLNLAVDLFRKDGISVRLKASAGVAFIDPDTSGQASREFERTTPFVDWRALSAPHAMTRLEPPFVFGARMSRKLSDATIGLARAAGSDDERYEIKGGVDSVVATFPAWEGAFAIFPMAPKVDHSNAATLWHPPQWVSGPRLAAVETMGGR